MAIGSVHQLIYLPGQIIYRYTAIQQIVATVKEIEKNTMDIFKVSPALAPQRGRNRLLGNAVAVLFQGKASYYMALSGQSMAIPVPGLRQTSSLTPSDRVSLSTAANGQSGQKMSEMALNNLGGA
jgi:hypothetical protein